jgi:AcrR family transcriptional regulator
MSSGACSRTVVAKLCGCSFCASLRASMPPQSGSDPSSAAAPRPRRPYAPRMPPEQRREQLLDAALSVIVEQGYSGVSIEAIARAAGVTRPVVYDHFPNLARLLHAVVEREERYSLEQLDAVVPDMPAERNPAELLSNGVRRFLDAVLSRPATWRIILLPLEGTPTIVREHVETNRQRMVERIKLLVQWAIDEHGLPAELDVELAARAVRDLGEEAGRMALTDPQRFSPGRYEQFVQSVMRLIWPS